MAELTQWQTDNSRPGMFHWPEPDNMAAGKLCGVCRHAYHSGVRDKIRCLKAAEAMKKSGRRGRPKQVPSDTPGCKYWEARR